jgi:predicted acylesterase/phospholipase RssA
MKNALVVSGGGSKGAFAVGAIEKLREKKIKFDIVAGTSTGSLIAPLVVTDEIQFLRGVYTSVRTEDIIRKRTVFDILTHDSIYDSNPLWSLINTVINSERYQKIVNSKVEMFITTVNLQKGEIEYWNQHTSGDGGGPLDRNTLLRAILASACQPVLMPNVRIKEGGNQYTDGGVRECAPLSIAVDHGATDLYSIVLSPEKREPSNETYIFIVKTFLRFLDLMLTEVTENDISKAVLYNQAIVYLDKLQKKAKKMLTTAQVNELFNDPRNPNPFSDKKLLNLYLIRPLEELPTSGLEFRPFEMSQMMAMGRQAAEDALKKGPLTV